VAVLACPQLDGTALRRLAWELEPTGADLIVAPTLVDVAGPRLSIRPVEGLPLLHVDHPTFTGLRRLLKVGFDRCLAGLALLLLSPLLAVIAVAVKLDSPGPVLFRQLRVGRLGQEFTILKFRSMVADAERRMDEVVQLNQGDGPLFKAHADPRVTRVGAFLRRTSLDELPQLVNVLLGQMSLVGPRPHLAAEVALFGSDMTRRMLVKPGLTGLWQVSGRSDLTWDESVRVDLRYVENWSFMLDVAILWKTLFVVLRRSGAY
jgi:exopolysaccharide biosynthesis polyprenyl glycosylphosphotransferase